MNLALPGLPFVRTCLLKTIRLGDESTEADKEIIAKNEKSRRPDFRRILTS
jgi:hypothetical protein